MSTVSERLFEPLVELHDDVRDFETVQRVVLDVLTRAEMVREMPRVPEHFNPYKEFIGVDRAFYLDHLRKEIVEDERPRLGELVRSIRACNELRLNQLGLHLVRSLRPAHLEKVRIDQIKELRAQVQVIVTTLIGFGEREYEKTIREGERLLATPTEKLGLTPHAQRALKRTRTLSQKAFQIWGEQYHYWAIAVEEERKSYDQYIGRVCPGDRLIDEIQRLHDQAIANTTDETPHRDELAAIIRHAEQNIGPYKLDIAIYLKAVHIHKLVVPEP